MFGFSKTKINTNESEINELLTRGIENIFPNTEFLKSKMLKGEKVSLYLGIDPTGETLHLGHVIPLKRLSKFQKMGHQIILLIGDFTAMIGDPTDKTATRKKLTREEVLNNLKEYKKQAEKFISFGGDNPALLKYNSDWLGKMNFNDVLELASNFTVQQMLEREMFDVRMKDGKPIFLHEFMYPLMQGYDSVAMDVDGEIGGNDQTWNMLAGRDLMKVLKNKEKFVIATKILADPNGKKMGKTENNMVALNQTPEDIFGKVMSWGDGMIINGFEIVTDVPREEIEKMAREIEAGSNPKDIKMKLAKEIVKMCYSDREAERAEENFNKTFSQGGIPEDVLTLSVAENIALVDILLSEKIVESKNEWRRLVESGAVTEMNSNEKITDPNQNAKQGVYRVGKRRFIKINIK